MTIDHYLTQLPTKRKPRRISAKVNWVAYRFENLILIKSLTFMNRSGEAVKEVCQDFGLDVENCLIIYDDLDIEFGKLKAKFKGSAGGHKGMQSIIETLKTDKVPRLKVGIGDNINASMDPEDYLLDEFTAKEKKALIPILGKACQAIELFRNSGITCVMNQIN